MSKASAKQAMRAVAALETVGLVVVLIAAAVAGGQAVWGMIQDHHVSLTDLLLLFIYLEVFAMVGVYWQSGRLPVRLFIYIAIVALSRYIILDMKSMDNWRIVAISGSILILTFSVLVIRFGHVRYPYKPFDHEGIPPAREHQRQVEQPAAQD